MNDIVCRTFSYSFQKPYFLENCIAPWKYMNFPMTRFAYIVGFILLFVHSEFSEG